MSLAPIQIRRALYRVYRFDFPRLVVSCASVVIAIRQLIVHWALRTFCPSGPSAIGISIIKLSKV